MPRVNKIDRNFFMFLDFDIGTVYFRERVIN